MERKTIVLARFWNAFQIHTSVFIVVVPEIFVFKHNFLQVFKRYYDWVYFTKFAQFKELNC